MERDDYNNYNDYRDSDLDWERFSELLTLWHSWLLLTNCETLIMTLSVSDLQSDSDLDSIRNSCDVWYDNLFQVQKVQNRRARNLQRGQNLGIIHDKNVWHWFSLFSCIVSQLNGREEFLYTFEGDFEFTLLNLDSRPL